MRRPGLSVAAKAVYAALATYADRIGWIWVRQETIASDLERSRAWVHAAIAELEAQGLLLHDRQYIEGRQRASRYQLRDGMARQAAEQRDAAPFVGVSADADAAVEPADTSHHDEIKQSHSTREGVVSAPASNQVPEDWVPTSADVVWAKTRHPDLDVLAFTESFVLSCRAKGYRYADPSAAWRRWLLEPKSALPSIPSRKPKTQENSHGNRGPEAEPAPNPAPNSGAVRQRRDAGQKPVGRGPDPELSSHNRERAAACLDRLLGRRAGHPPAGHAG
jgi:hypothetical protein